jgi:hypothetical protein
MKTELEEAAENYAESKSSKFSFRNTHIRDFTAGAEWQSKRMYSDKEVESLLHKYMQSQIPDWHGYSTAKWFEQNKKT